MVSISYRAGMSLLLAGRQSAKLVSRRTMRRATLILWLLAALVSPPTAAAPLEGGELRLSLSSHLLWTTLDTYQAQGEFVERIVGVFSVGRGGGSLGGGYALSPRSEVGARLGMEQVSEDYTYGLSADPQGTTSSSTQRSAAHFEGYYNYNLPLSDNLLFFEGAAGWRHSAQPDLGQLSLGGALGIKLFAVEQGSVDLALGGFKGFSPKDDAGVGFGVRLGLSLWRRAGTGG